MTCERRAFIATLLATLSVPVAQAADAVAEIEYLLHFVEQSQCRFLRNGHWYEAATAAAHLRAKYRIASAPLASAEEFIDEVASRSAWSGQQYEIKCANEAPRASSQWLRAALQLHRTAIDQQQH